MQKCSNCSAPLQDVIEQCTFCGTLTDRGVQARQQRAAQGEAERNAAAQRAAADQVRARAAAQLSVDTSGKWALLSSLVGSFVCCFVPVGPILGIVFGMRSRGLAAQHGLSGSPMGTAGLVFGVMGLVSSLVFWVAGGVLMVRENQHRAELKAALGDLTAPQLELKSACVLTELELLDTKFDGYSSLEDFECGPTPGELEVNGDQAVLRGVHFLRNERRMPLVACFHHRNKWSVKQLRHDDDCNAPPPVDDDKEAKPRKAKHE